MKTTKRKTTLKKRHRKRNSAILSRGDSLKARPKRTHIDALTQLPFPLVNMIEPGIGFRIGGVEGEFALAGTDGETWTYTEPKTGLQVIVSMRVVGQVVVLCTVLENKGRKPVSGLEEMEPLAVTLRHPGGKWRFIHAHGGTSEEHYPPLAYRTQEWNVACQNSYHFSIGSHPEGRSSNLHLPFLIGLSSTAPESEGFFCAMEWSGVWHNNFRRVDAERGALGVGVKMNGLTLAAGERLALPDVHLGFFTGGPDAGTNALRRYLYEQVCPTYQGRPTLPRISYDHWFGIDNGLNLGLMKQQADRAAELGVEVFVVDAAWFPGGFPDGVGNWNGVDRSKFPDGLEPLADYVRSLGMDFGLWFEVERAVEGTDMVREHPEWFVSTPCWTSKPSYHLNLALPEAQDYLIEMMGGWIRKLDIRWSRWDYNIDPMSAWKKIDPTLKIQVDYFAGLYRVLDTLMKEHPNWMVEGCASGGRRIDIGTMKRAHTYWFSDQTDLPKVCRYMQARANRFLPGHLLNSSVAVSAHVSDEDFDDTAVLSRMLGKLAFDGWITKWSPKLTARMASWVAVFKEIRHLLVQDFYQLLPQPQSAEDWDAVQFASYPGDEAVVFVFAGASAGKMSLPLRGLKRNRRYQVSRMLTKKSSVLSGKELMEAGLPVTLHPNQSGLWRITEQ